MPFLTLLTACLMSTALAFPGNTVPRATCATGLHILVARGTGASSATGGSIAQIYREVLSQVPGSDVSQIEYPAESDYTSSCAIGVDNMRQQITSYASQCPQSKIVLLGYSQGAWVIGDLLSGNGLCGNSQALDSEYIGNIASIVQVADPAQAAGAFFNSGTGSLSNGRYSRPTTSQYNNYSGKIVEFCAVDDYWCASSGDANARAVHSSACATFKDPAVSFIVSHK